MIEEIILAIYSKVFVVNERSQADQVMINPSIYDTWLYFSGYIVIVERVTLLSNCRSNAEHELCLLPVPKDV